MARRRAIGAYLRSLRGQTVLTVIGIHAVMIPVLLAVVVFFVRQAFTEQFVNQIRSDTRLLGNLVPDGASSAQLDQIFYEATLSGPLDHAAIIDEQGTVTWSISRLNTQMGPRGEQLREDFFFGQGGDQTYHISIPAADAAGAAGGQLWLGFDERPTAEQIQALYARAGTLTAAYLLLTLALAAYWISRLTRPLRALGERSREVASGEVREAIQVDTSLSEIRELAADINHMREQLLRKTDSMEHLAMHDALTGLPNRALLMDRVKQALREAKRDGSTLALALMDLDHFKEVNDTLGHAVGDRVLCMLPDRLKTCLRDGDTLARLGGDEFAFLLPETDSTGAVKAVQRISAAMEPTFAIDGHNLHLGMSVGIALFPEHATDSSSLFRQVDIAMYSAKLNRREYSIYDPEFDPHSTDRLALASELRRDISAGRLQVHYQPQIRLGDRSLCAIEALCRWHHPERGQVATDHFIPLAERLGLMDSLTRDVVRQAFRDFAAHPQLQDLTLSLNISANNLHDPHLPQLLAEALSEFGMSANSVVLELTEHEYLTHIGNAPRQLAILREQGFGIAIDDFGTGHSSFTYLKHLPATEVKIDRSFVTDMARDRHDYSLVAAISALGQTLGLSVVAEGVQDATTLGLLAELGCHRAQGFHLSRPLPIGELLAFVTDYEARPQRAS